VQAHIGKINWYRQAKWKCSISVNRPQHLVIISMVTSEHLIRFQWLFSVNKKMCCGNVMVTVIHQVHSMLQRGRYHFKTLLQTVSKLPLTMVVSQLLHKVELQLAQHSWNEIKIHMHAHYNNSTQTQSTAQHP